MQPDGTEQLNPSVHSDQIDDPSYQYLQPALPISFESCPPPQLGLELDLIRRSLSDAQDLSGYETSCDGDLRILYRHNKGGSELADCITSSPLISLSRMSTSCASHPSTHDVRWQHATQYVNEVLNTADVLPDLSAS